MANHKSGSERYNDRMHKIVEDAKRLEHERLRRGEMPNPSLTAPEDARKYGWEIVGRTVTRMRVKCQDCCDNIECCPGHAVSDVRPHHD